METINFQQSIGVFEGGGVLGAAYAGAYKAATDAKINFIANVGTSAGSIAATLISAGFTPDEMMEIMKKPFKDFLHNSTSPNAVSKKLLISTLRFFGEPLHKLIKIQYGLGLYSSESIENWIEQILKKKLGVKNRPVVFNDLPKKLAVIATNLNSSTYKIWSSQKTPESSVAFAVRCSCTIPYFFQPVTGENCFYVDGGLISNLPIFLVSELEMEENIPILCFRLIQNKLNAKANPTTGIDLTKMLIPCILNGVTDVQLSLNPNNQIIDIPTEDFNSIDFDISEENLNRLVQNGIKSIEDFITNEQIRLIQPDYKSLSLKSFREGLLEETAKIIKESRNEIFIFAGDLSWLKELQISLLAATFRNINIKIICEDLESEDFNDAINAAKSIGADVLKVSELSTLKGTAIDLFTDNAKMIAIEEKPITHGRIYSLPNDSGFINLIRTSFNQIWSSGEVIKGSEKPELIPIPEAHLIETLQSEIPFYRNLNITTQTIPIEKLMPLSKFLEYLKLNRLAELEQLLNDNGLPNSAYIKDNPWAILPPIIERLNNDDLVIIDGTHRVYYSKQIGRKELRVILIENPNVPLPSIPLNWNQVIIKSNKVRRNERYEHYNPDFFRKIRSAFKHIYSKLNEK